MRTVKMNERFSSEIKDVMDIAFDLQPEYFTSNILGNTVRDLLNDNPELYKVLDIKMKQGYLADYLAGRQNELQRLTPKQYRKIKTQKKELIVNNSEIDKAIILLKMSGYKVLKQTITFDEI